MQAVRASSRWPIRVKDALGSARAMPFEAELVFGGVVNGLDPLPHPTEVPVPLPLVLAVRPDQRHLDLRGAPRNGDPWFHASLMTG
jgi:hypothetical protein